MIEFEATEPLYLVKITFFKTHFPLFPYLVMNICFIKQPLENSLVSFYGIICWELHLRGAQLTAKAPCGQWEYARLGEQVLVSKRGFGDRSL